MNDQAPLKTTGFISSPRALTVQQMQRIHDVWTICDSNAQRFREIVEALGGDVKIEEFPTAVASP